MTVPVTVLIPTLPGREHMLARALESVWAQTEHPAALLVRGSDPDPAGLGPVHLASQRNALLASVQTPWVATLDDDDWWHPHHLEVAAAHFDTSDVVYSWPEPKGAISEADCTDWTQLVLRARLRHSNFIPSDACIRLAALDHVGGWQTEGYSNGRYETGASWEDWDLWIRLADADARFTCTGQVTWHYTLEGDHHAMVGR